MKEAPAYKKICTELKGQIASGVLPPGSLLPTVKELRERYGVSHITILHALRELRAEGTVEAAGRRCAVPARSAFPELRTFSTVGVLTRSLWPFSVKDNYFNDINFGIDDECAVCNLAEVRLPPCRLLNAFPVIPLSTLEEIRRACARLPEIDGFIFDERLPDETIAEILEERHLPAVVVNRRTALDIPAVLPDNAGAVNLLVETARRFGCENFIFCRDSSDSPNGRERLEAFLAAGVPPERRRIVNDVTAMTIQKALPEFFAAFDELKHTGRIMILAASDSYARELLNLSGNCQEFDKVPFSIAGIGNLGHARNFSPRICAVDTGSVQLGRLAVRTLCGGAACNVIHPPIRLELGETLR